ncbi:DUF4142 domain-containing protein [Methylorubrum salsuginis]|uniref:DUF4142 domain-containing protein n=1 Tax=Methylorubrum salsuginis TaxID=414703 RepID=A0A1I4KNR5_9HYPH|nr:DUF4142 domain-containing protein [Methylorubrum salsuginis]SFL80199.1 protein of unknown function [Methylorubrum salsuginis]
MPAQASDLSHPQQDTIDMTLRSRLIAASLGLSIAGLGSAQAQVPGLDGSLLGSPAVNTGVFRAEALRNDAYSIEAGRIALARSNDPKVRRLAQRSISNRQATTDALLPPSSSLTPGGIVVDERALPLDAPFAVIGAPAAAVGAVVGVPAVVDAKRAEPGKRVALDPASQKMLANLSAANGRDFDAVYSGQLAAANADNVRLYRSYARTGDSVAGRQFAIQALPMLKETQEDGADLHSRKVPQNPAD